MGIFPHKVLQGGFRRTHATLVYHLRALNTLIYSPYMASVNSLKFVKFVKSINFINCIDLIAFNKISIITVLLIIPSFLITAAPMPVFCCSGGRTICAWSRVLARGFLLALNPPLLLCAFVISLRGPTFHSELARYLLD